MGAEHFELMEIEQIAVLIQTSAKLGILDALLRGPATADGLTQQLSLSSRPTALLLEALTAIGYLMRTGDKYEASPAFHDLRNDISFNWSHFPEHLRTGKPWIEIDGSAASTEKFYNDFFACLDYAAEMTPAAEAVASRLVGQPERILDLGAGTGVWSLAMAQRSPQTHVTAIDLPDVLKSHFLRRARELHCLDRVDVIAGDFHQVPLPEETYDRITLGQSFHFIREELAPALVGHMAASLRPGGDLVIIDHFANDKPFETLSRLLYEIRLAMRTSHARNYPQEVIEDWCEGAGLTRLECFRVDGPGFLAVLVFRKPRFDRVRPPVARPVPSLVRLSEV